MEQLLLDDESSEYFGGGPVLHQLPPWQATRDDDMDNENSRLARLYAILSRICEEQAEEISRMRKCVQQLTAALENK